jgi:TRAP-type C4-dicarboxylate transport system permease small subunit
VNGWLWVLIVIFLLLLLAGGWFVTGGLGRRQRARTGRIDRGGPVTVAVVCGLMIVVIGFGVYLLVRGA